MRRAFEVYRRPLLDVGRAQTEAACRAEGIAWWEDPHNDDPRFLRSRVRRTVLPLLEEELGPGVATTLARTADQLRADTELLDALADEALAAVLDDGALVVGPARRAGPGAAGTGAAAGRPGRRGASGRALPRARAGPRRGWSRDWHGQRWIDLPGPLRAVRRDGRIVLERP